MRRWLICGIFLLIACEYQPPGALPYCEPGETAPNAVCQDGLWVLVGGPDIDMDQLPDVALPEHCDLPAVAFCEHYERECGPLSVPECSRTEICGPCAESLVCDQGICTCPDSDDAGICQDQGLACGNHSLFDEICQVNRTVRCGDCGQDQACNPSGACECFESDQRFCERLQTECGIVSAMTICGAPHETNCGGCAAPAVCGLSVANQCGCDAAVVCEEAETQCGDVNVDNCPGMVSCGDCGLNGQCQGSTCVCAAGFEYQFGSQACEDIDECAGGHTCDLLATCTNTPGSYTCECAGGSIGDGRQCWMPVVRRQSRSSAGDQIEGITPMIAGPGLHIVAIALRHTEGSGGPNDVLDVTGLGLTWTKVGSQCGNQQQSVHVFAASGVAQAGNLSAQLTGATASVVTYHELSGQVVPQIVNDHSWNQAGSGCSSDASSSYSFDISTDHPSYLLTATSIRGRIHTPGAGWDEVLQVHDGAVGDAASAGIAVMDRVATDPMLTVAGTLNQNTAWAVFTLEIQ